MTNPIALVLGLIIVIGLCVDFFYVRHRLPYLFSEKTG